MVRVSPGWVETEAAVGLVQEIARQNHIDYEAARNRLMTSIGGIPIGSALQAARANTLVKPSPTMRCHPLRAPSGVTSSDIARCGNTVRMKSDE